MTDQELILNFVNQYNRPFDAEVIAKFTDLRTVIITEQLTILIDNQTIKLIEDNPQIYAKTNRYQARIG